MYKCDYCNKDVVWGKTGCPQCTEDKAMAVVFGASPDGWICYNCVNKINKKETKK